MSISELTPESQKIIRDVLSTIDGTPDDELLVAYCVMLLDEAGDFLQMYKLLEAGKMIANERNLTDNDRSILRDVYIDNRTIIDRFKEKHEKQDG